MPAVRGGSGRAGVPGRLNARPKPAKAMPITAIG